jgi:hypothetical protein
MVRWHVFGAAALVLLTACETMPWDRRSSSSGDVMAGDGTADTSMEAPIVAPPGLQLSAESRFADVPLPSGVREDRERTYVYESKTVQIGRMVYTLRASVADVAQFYIRECPVSGWKLERSLQADGAELLFEKPGKRLEVIVRDIGLARGGTSLVLHLTPIESQM